MINLYLVRHGETELNKTGVYYGITDCSLTMEGLKQCEEVKEKLVTVSFDSLVTSPLKRAIETIHLIKSKKDKIQIDERLCELNFGLWENKHYELIKSEFPKEWDAWCNDWRYYAPPEGESLDQVYKRIKDFVHDIKRNNINENVLVVSHQGCLRLILSELLFGSLEGYWYFKFDQGYYSHLEIDDRGHCTIININR